MLWFAKINNMLTVIIRVILIFFILLVVIRMMGKRQIGEMEPFELAITLVIAELACIPIADKSIPLTAHLQMLVHHANQNKFDNRTASNAANFLC